MNFLQILLTLLCTTLPLFTFGNSKPFVVGHLVGQFGNQMFIIAATTSLALDNDAIPCFPDLLNPPDPSWNIETNYKNVFFRLNAAKPDHKIDYTYTEPEFNYNPISFHPNMEVKGYFQSEKYFVNHKQEILRLFNPSKKITNYLKTNYGRILSHPNSVSIHFRSYHKEDPEQRCHITQDVNYFEKAIYLFPDDSLFVVFSNNIPLCKKLFNHIPRKFLYIEGEAHYHDFYLMSMCKHNIICNSSFSWWAAYLNKNPNKIVVAPSLWFNPNYISNTKDIIPEDWLVIQQN